MFRSTRCFYKQSNGLDETYGINGLSFLGTVILNKQPF